MEENNERPTKKRPDTLQDKSAKKDRKPVSQKDETVASPQGKRIHATRMESIRWNPDDVFKENPYYIRIANRYRLLKYILIGLTLAFGIFMMTVFSSDITPENFQYLVKDLDFSGLSTISDFETLVYSGGADSSFGIYRGELVVVNAGSTLLYKSSGALSINKTNIFYSPMLLTSDKYFLVYDRGETSRSYSIFNAFSELKTEKLDYPITGAALSDDGSYAIVTRDDNFRGIVRFYDRDFRLKMEIKKDKYILSVSISDDGKSLAIASVYDQNGNYMTELMLVSSGKNEADMTVTKAGTMPLKIRIMEDGSIGVLYTDSAVIYNQDGTERSAFSYASSTSVSAVFGDSFVCLVYNTAVIGNDKTVEIFDTDGKKLFGGQISGELLSIVTNGMKNYLLFEDRAVMIDPTQNEVLETPVEPNPMDIVFVSDTPVACYSGVAHVLNFVPTSDGEDPS